MDILPGCGFLFHSAANSEFQSLQGEKDREIAIQTISTSETTRHCMQLTVTLCFTLVVHTHAHDGTQLPEDMAVPLVLTVLGNADAGLLESPNPL